DKGPRHIRLYLTYLGKDGKPRITTAENFPVAGDREPTIFSREVKPLVEPSTIARDATSLSLRGVTEFGGSLLWVLAAAGLAIFYHAVIPRTLRWGLCVSAGLLFVLSLSGIRAYGAPFPLAVFAASSIVRACTMGILVGGLAVWMRNRLRLGSGEAD